MLKRKKISLKGKSKKSSQEDTSWVLDGIVGYLQSPTWTAPIMNFVEDNCGCFEVKEENKFEYTDIHIKYKDLVENLLFKYIRELNISEDLFAEACNNKHKSTMEHVEGVFEYVWAADDFLLFKRLMARHNVELDMQAISMVQMQNKPPPTTGEKGQVIPSAPYPSGNTGLGDPFRALEEPDHESKVDFILAKSKKEFEKASSFLQRLQAEEEYNLQRAIEFSKQETERLNKLAEMEKEMLERAIRLSLMSANEAEQSSGGRHMKDVDEGSHSSHTISPSESHTSITSPSGSSTSISRSSSHHDNIIPDVVTSSTPSAPMIITSAQPTTTDSRVTADVKSTKTKLKKSSESTTAVTSPSKSLAPLKKRNASDIANDWIQGAKQESQESSQLTNNSGGDGRKQYESFNPNAIDPADLAQRKEYLKKQREKILEAKRQQRQQELKSHQEETGAVPTSASEEALEPSKDDAEKQKMLNARRALAERLKREVIGKKK